MDTISVSQFDRETPNRIFIYRERHSGFRSPHRHDFVEIGLVLDGVGTQTTRFGDQKLERGDVVLMTPAAWHGLADSSGLLIHFCCFSPSMLRQELVGLMEDPQVRYFLQSGPWHRQGVLSLHLSSEELEVCVGYTDAIWDVAGGVGTDGSASALSPVKPIVRFWRQLAYLTLLLTYLAELCEQSDTGAIQPVDTAMMEIIGAMEARPHEDWSLTKLAKIACLEPSYFIRRFRKEIGVSPMQYLYHVRMQRASELLTGTDKSVSEVGQESGFSDPTYFSARFREYFRVSPSHYRRQLRGG
jgi:AraC-like DNA-binding protein